MFGPDRRRIDRRNLNCLAISVEVWMAICLDAGSTPADSIKSYKSGCNHFDYSRFCIRNSIKLNGSVLTH